MQVQGKNEVVKQLLAKSNTTPALVQSAYALSTIPIIAYAWYDTRPEHVKDFLRGIPVLIFMTVFFFFCCFL
jgi:hypothetical protein